nr:MAG TPA: hypothetical protein [Bacteriophage sp.]
MVYWQYLVKMSQHIDDAQNNACVCHERIA